MANRVSTHLMFTGEATDALELYASTFPSFRVENIERYGPEGPGPESSIFRAAASFNGQSLIVIDSPVKHAFTFTPAMSLFVDCDTRDELDSAFDKLSTGGQVFMPLGNYGFSSWFGWCTDRFGVSWQLNLP